MKILSPAFGILAITIFLLTPAHAQTFLTNGLVAYYPFNGNANDASGQGNNGTVQGAMLTTDRFGMANSAYSFDGLSSLIVIPDTLFGPTVQAVTISAWITTDNGPYSTADFQDVFEKGSANGELTVSIGLGQIFFGPDLATYRTSYKAIAPVRSNSLMHLVGVYRRGQSSSLYINGALASSTNSPDDDLYVSSSYPLLSSIGGYDYTPGPFGSFNGTIDDVRVYTNALSASEVQQLYALEAPCVPHRAVATASLMEGIVQSATVTDGGCGYTNAPLVLIQGGGGTGAAATSVVSNGVVVGVSITSAGAGYTSTPTIYIYSPVGLQIGLIEALKPSFSDLLIGTNYQLQVSTDLNTWSNQGAVFTATNAYLAYPQYFDVTNRQQLFFRLHSVP